MSTQSYGRGIALAAAGMLVISPDGLLIRLLDATGPWQLVFWRTAFMALALAVGLAIAYGGRLLPIARALGGGGLLAGIIIGLSNVTFVGAITNTTVANTLVILATLPLFAALFARAILGERVAPRTWAVIAVAFAGMVLIFANSLGGGSLTGDALALLTAALFSLGVVILRRAGNRDMTAALWVGAMVSALIALPLSLAGPSGLSLSGLVVPAGDMAILALLGLLILPLAFTLYIAGARYAPAAEIGLISLLQTVLGPLWAWLGVGERPAAAALAGGAVVIAAIAINSTLPLLRRRRRPA